MAFDPLPTTDDPGLSGAAASSQPPSGGARYKFVSFFLGDKHYAVPAYAVAEVVGHLSPTRLPDSPPKLLGIAPLRGDILAVVDAGASVTAPIGLSKQKAVVLRPNLESAELPIAFNVDRLGEMLQIAASQVRFAGNSDPLAEFETAADGRSVLIIEPGRIQDLLFPTVQ